MRRTLWNRGVGLGLGSGSGVGSGCAVHLGSGVEADGLLHVQRVQVAVDGGGHCDDGCWHAARCEALGEGGGVGGGDRATHLVGVRG